MGAGVIPKLIATDLDGTLLHSDGTVDERTCRALAAAEAAGVGVVICTARPPRWLRPIAQATGHHGLAVCANGAVVWDLHTEAVVSEFPLHREVCAEVVSRLRSAVPGGTWAVETVRRFGHEPEYAPKWPVPDDTVIDVIDALLGDPAIKLLMRHPSLPADGLLQVAREVLGDLVEVSHSSTSDALLEISAAGVSKASALAGLCAERGISPAEVVAFGDMPNDLPMLTWAGRGVAVANAHPDVVAAADEVTASNDDDGVACVLERLLGQ